ncbi:MAG: glycosyltransferase family 2 protein [Candidatus Azambacteria bacterium]|nr:glycosyltransferase family 2 protein [Candidatus Azambacteria bacterium]
MKLSFVVPAYNEENLIGECLESILKQTANQPNDIEIIVVNNASTDNTKKVALSFPEVIVVDEPKKGLVNARHAGFMASHGDLIANIDADTMLTPGWVNKVFEEFSKNQNLVALSGPYIYYDLSKTQNFFIKIYYFMGYLSYVINHFIFHAGAMLQGGNFIVKRTALEKIGGFDTSIVFYGEDTDIAKRIQKVGRVKFTFKLPMYTSGRRLKKEGVLTMAFRYSINYIWVTIFKRPFTKNYLDIRLKK